MHRHFMQTFNKIFKNTYINFWPYYMGYNMKEKIVNLKRGQYKP